MIAAARAQRACPQCRIQVLSAIENSFALGRRELPQRPKFQLSRGTRARLLSTTRTRYQEPTPDAAPSTSTGSAPKGGDMETTVRQAKQTFGNTLPKDYLTTEEYNLYVRFYGEPLRETEPDDVGIPVPDPVVRQDPEDPSKRTILREMQDGTIEEITYHVDVEESADAEAHEPQQDTQSTAGLSANVDDLPSEAGLQYIGAVAKNEREYNALLKLQKDFEQSSLQPEKEEVIEDEEPMEEEPLEEEEEEEENETGMVLQRAPRSDSERLHDHTKAGQWRTNPSTLHLPKREFVEPTTEILQRTSTTHIKAAAEEMFGGSGLPHSVATPASKRNSPQEGPAIGPGLPKMSEIDADAYMATNLPGMYASTMSILTEVRKRLGPGWVDRMFARGDGPKVLDVGAGGAGLAAWDQIVQAEWDLARDTGRKQGSEPPGRKTVVVGSDNLRSRISQFLHNTTFLPRLPDYLHSGDHPDKLDGGEATMPRKQFDVIIAAHQLMPIKEDYRRKALLDNLWEMLSPDGGIIIFLEKGHPRGFEAVADVRSRLLNEFIVSPTSEPPLPSIDGLPPRREREEGSIIAPCTTHKECPMYLNPGLTPGRKDFCHFSQRYIRPPYLQRVLGAKHENHEDIDFSFVAVQRGVTSNLERPTNHQQEKDLTEKAFQGYEKSNEAPNPLALPRNVMAPLKRRGHVTMDLCTPAGTIERWTIPKSFSKQAYHDARKAQWGDLWALGAKTRVERPVRLGRGGPAPNDGGKRSDAARQSTKKTKTINVFADEHGIFKTSGNKRDDDVKKDKSHIPKSMRKGKSWRTLRHGKKHRSEDGNIVDEIRAIRSRAVKDED